MDFYYKLIYQFYRNFSYLMLVIFIIQYSHCSKSCLATNLFLIQLGFSNLFNYHCNYLGILIILYKFCFLFGLLKNLVQILFIYSFLLLFGMKTDFPMGSFFWKLYFHDFLVIVCLENQTSYLVLKNLPFIWLEAESNYKSFKNPYYNNL